MRVSRDTLAIWALCAVGAAVVIGVTGSTARAVALAFIATTAVEAWVVDAWRRVAMHSRGVADHWREVAMLASLQVVQRREQPHDDRRHSQLRSSQSKGK